MLVFRWVGLSGLKHSWFRVLAGSCLGLALIAGCEKPEEIRVYTVAKPPPLEIKDNIGEKDNVQPIGPAAGPAATTSAGPAQMLGAIAPRGRTTWFFKLIGPPAAVSALKSDFETFVRSLTFTDRGPKWRLPEGWEAEPGSQMRFATIRIPVGDKPLELSVIPLPNPGEDFGDQLLANVNRWRDQVALAAITAEQLAQSAEVRKIEVDGEAVWLTDFTGESKGNTMGGPPAGAPANSTPGPRHNTEALPKSVAKLPFDAQVPANWVAGPASQFQLAVFEVQEGNQKAIVSVSTAGGDLAMNINRWRDQVMLPEVNPAELSSSAQKLQIDGHEGTYVELVGPETAEKRKTILGVIVEAEGKQWFIKLTGDVELAKIEKPHFEAFLKSIKFRDTPNGRK